MARSPGTRLIERRDGGPTWVLCKARLEVTAGPDAGRSVDLIGASLRVGTASDNDLVLADETVSQHHFEIVVTERGALVRDLDSTNGTLVDDHRVGAVYLDTAAVIVVGDTRLRWTVLSDAVEIPLSRATNFGDLLGHGPAMRAAFAVLERAARTDATVLVLGESGTGKELAARALHGASQRSDGPYVVFDCGAVTASLVESQLFGHARGAFTGAVDARPGVFEEADGGTLVLDEIGELPLELQPRLLRVLETRTVQRLGEHKTRTVDVRFVASTNRNLVEEVRAGRFREDLYFRLSVITVRMPPLRERREEVPRLARHFASRLSGDRLVDVPADVMALLSGHDWPGNVRELRNVIERFATLHDLDPRVLLGPRMGGVEEAAPKGPVASLDIPFHEAKARFVDAFERDYLGRLLEAHGGNVSEVARVAGISRQSCYRLMQKHGIRTD